MNRPAPPNADATFHAHEALWEDGERVLCRIWRSDVQGDRRRFLAVISPDVSSRLAHEYGLRDLLDDAWALRPRELVRERGQTIMLLGDREGEPLERSIGQPMEIGRFLQVAVALADALAQLHARGLVHKDLKPANIFVDGSCGRVWLMGFGVASRLPREHSAPDAPELIAGTLSHMAPEQTGRINRSIDSRSDLYALGVTLYQALTGSLPFSAKDPMEWVHCHIARKPPPPHSRSPHVPKHVSAIVLKLLAKTPEERYQTAAGVEHDLRRCLADWKSRSAIDTFPLGETDRPKRLILPEQLYGRASELRVLQAAFEDVLARGTTGLVLVSGQPGVGKSSLVRELHKLLVPTRGLFASGKFDAQKRDVPSAPLAQAFQSLFRRVLSKPESELAKWREDFRLALDRNGALAAEVIPELKFILGEQPPSSDIPSPAAKARLSHALRRVIGVFARAEHPLVLFFDDLQWADAATLDLIEELLLQPESQHLLLVGAYRDNEVDETHPLLRKLSLIRQSDATIRTIALRPLEGDDLARWIGDAFQCEPARALPLAQLIHDKTAGNPFFVHQFIRSLVDDSSITFEASAGTWAWNPQAIRAKVYTENVVDLMIGRLRRLPLDTQKLLQVLACLGNVASTSELAITHAASAADVHALLFEALRLELIVRAEDSYRFVHDRIQEAAYSLIPAGDRARVHLTIGRRLLEWYRQGQRKESIFELVGQLNRGSMLIQARAERDELAELNLTAGKRAKASTAYASALHYLTLGATLANDAWERRRNLIFELELQRAECEFLTGAVPAAEQRLTALSQHAIDTIERAAIVCLLADVYIPLRRLDRSIAVCLDYVRAAGIALAPQPTAAAARAAYDGIWSRLGSRSIEGLAELPLLTDPFARATLDVLAKIARCALTEMDMDLLCVILCAAIDLSQKHGNCDSSCYAYAYFGVVAGWRFGDFAAGSRFGRLGRDLVERQGLRQHEALVSLTLAIRILPWAAPARSCRDGIRRAFDLGNKSGDRVSAVASCCALVSNLLLTGEPLEEVEREAEVGLAFCRHATFRDFIDAADTQAAFVRNLRGLTREFGSFDDERFDELRMRDYFERQPHARVFECWYWIRTMQARFLAGNHSDALDASQRAKALMSSSPALLEAAEYELYSALTLAALSRGTSAEALAAHQRQLETWARHSPENFAHRAALVAAEIARLDGRELEAMKLYDQAIGAAQQNGFIQDEALATELAAHFYAARGFDKIAKAYLKDARHCYLRWGANGKVRQLDARYPHLRNNDPRLDPARTVQASVAQLDLENVLKVLSAVAEETELEGLITTIMRLALEHAGADRGLLILPHGDGYRIEAEATVDHDSVRVALRHAPVTADELPTALFHYVVRTSETVLLQDAGARDAFVDDEYGERHRARSSLCMPLLKQARLVGVIYLENELTEGVFTPSRMGVLRLVASEAAISLENARLYRDLREREARVRRLVDSNIIGILIWNSDGRILDTNEAFLHIVDHSREELISGRVLWTDLVPPEANVRVARTLAELEAAGASQPHEIELFRKDGSRVPVLVGSAKFDKSSDEGVSFVFDLTERKRADEALRESERQSRLIVDCIPGMVALLTATGQIEFLNRQVFEYFGKTFEQLGRWNIDDTVHPEDLAHVIDEFGRSIASGTPYSITQRFRRFDGAYRWFLNTGFPVRDADDQINRWCVLLSDIDERKRAEDALRASEGNLKQFIDKMPALAWSARADGSAEFFSKHYLDYLGISHENAGGWGWLDAVHPEDRDHLIAAWERLHASKAPGEAEARLRRHDGEYRWFLFRANPVRDDHGNIVSWYGINTDIEDRKRAENDLRSAYNSIAEAQRLSKTGSFVSNSTDDRSWSVEACRIFGFDPASKLTMHRIMEVLHPDDVPTLEAMLVRARLGGHLDFTIRIVPDGVLKYVRAVAHSVVQDSGRPLIVGAFQDVTETKLAEEALNRARDELAHVARFASLSTLSASIAHEVSQPLAGMLTNASACLRMLDGTPPNVDGARRTATRMIRDSNRASDVIARLRALFSKKAFTLEPLNLNEATREIIAMSMSELQRNGVILRSELASDLPAVAGDRVQLQQVILNLVRNASDAMLDVHDRPRQLTIRTELTDGHDVRLTVRDTGTGLDPENMHNLFESFYTTKTNGMGIGLSVSLSIIERHNGRLWTEPNAGPGATFSFSIPRSPPAQRL